jgi:hypothetical protein
MRELGTPKGVGSALVTHGRSWYCLSVFGRPCSISNPANRMFFLERTFMCLVSFVVLGDSRRSNAVSVSASYQSSSSLSWMNRHPEGYLSPSCSLSCSLSIPRISRKEPVATFVQLCPTTSTCFRTATVKAR